MRARFEKSTEYIPGKRQLKNIRMIKYLILLVFTCTSIYGSAQVKTDVSLYLKKDKNTYLDEISSESGNLFNKLGHHGPAIENQYLAIRVYFNKKAAIDIYSKEKPGLELKAKRWYPSKKDQLAGYGADYYKVGKTLGLGGVRLWDGENIIPLHPVRQRSAKVFTQADSSYLEMLSEGIPYRGKTVDILVRVSVYADKREAKVEAYSLNGEPVQFVTGINYFDQMKVVKEENYIATWGIHPEDVAAEKVELGAAILFNNGDFEKQLNDGTQHLLISKPSQYLTTWITSANARELEINSFQKFIKSLMK